MPTTQLLATPAGERSTPARAPRAWRRSLRALAMAGIALGILLPGTAARAEPSLAEIEKQIDKQGTALGKLIEEYKKVKEDLKRTENAAKKHAAALPGLQTKYAEAETEVRAIAGTAYKNGNLREINVMLEARQGDALVDRLGALDHLARGRKAQIDEYTSAKQTYDAEKQRLDMALAKQKIQMRDMNARRAKINKDLDKLYKLRRDAYGSEQESGGGYTGKVPNISGNAGIAVTYAYGAIGKPYRMNAAGPSAYDCSGLTMAAWRAAGKSLPHNAADQWDATTRLTRSELQAGDLVFYSGLGHVAIYVGNNRVIHAPTAGQNVKLASINMMAPYGYGRV